MLALPLMWSEPVTHSAQSGGVIEKLNFVSAASILRAARIAPVLSGAQPTAVTRRSLPDSVTRTVNPPFADTLRNWLPSYGAAATPEVKAGADVVFMTQSARSNPDSAKARACAPVA